AVRTDFILSAEIIAITLATVTAASFTTQLGVLTTVAVLVTVGVYGLVAGIVKLDDIGLYLSRRPGEGFLSRLQRASGRGIVLSAPYMMKTLSIVGTAAMFLVGGGIITHGIPALDRWIEALAAQAATWPGVGGVLSAVLPTLLDGIVGILLGALVLAVVTGVKRIVGGGEKKPQLS
nr:DUF808 family protein [Methylibium sp.]